MSLQYRKSKSVGNGARLNVSQRGVSVSKRVGPLTASSRGNMSLRLAPGLSYRMRGKKGGAAGALLAVALGVVLLWTVKVAAVLAWRLMLVLAWTCRWVWFSGLRLAERVRANRSAPA